MSIYDEGFKSLPHTRGTDNNEIKILFFPNYQHICNLINPFISHRTFPSSIVRIRIIPSYSYDKHQYNHHHTVILIHTTWIHTSIHLNPYAIKIGKLLSMPRNIQGNGSRQSKVRMNTTLPSIFSGHISQLFVGSVII